MTAGWLFDTSVYIAVLRDNNFAMTFRPRYLQDVPRTSCSSVVVQELLAGARTARQRRQAADLYEPFERMRRVVTPTHRIWKEAGAAVAVLWEQFPQMRTKLTGGFLNDVLIALSSRSIGATVVTLNGEDFRLIQQYRHFALEVLDMP